MAWVRLDDSAMSNLKIQRISDSAFRLWMKGLCYCQMHLTDGFIPREALGPMEGKRRDVDMLCSPQVEGKASLWVRLDDGFQVYSYLQYNDSKAEVEEKRGLARSRMKRKRDPDDVRANFARTSHELLEKLRESPHANTPFTCTSSSGSSSERESEGKPRSGLIVTEEISQRAAHFLEKYAELYATHRHGAKLLRRRPALDWDFACQLCGTWDDARLEKMAVIFLTTDEEWIQKTDRGFGVFVAKATWCDERLSAWEASQKVRA